MTSFLNNIKDEINERKKIWIPTIIICSLAFLFSIAYVLFRIMQEQHSAPLIIVVVPLLSILFFAFILCLLIYTIHRIPLMKPMPFALIVSTVVALVVVGTMSDYHPPVYLLAGVGLLVFILVFKKSYTLKKHFNLELRKKIIQALQKGKTRSLSGKAFK